MTRDLIAELREDLGQSIDDQKLAEAQAEIERLRSKLAAQRAITEKLRNKVLAWSMRQAVDGWPHPGHVELGKILRGEG